MSSHLTREKALFLLYLCLTYPVVDALALAVAPPRGSCVTFTTVLGHHTALLALFVYKFQHERASRKIPPFPLGIRKHWHIRVSSLHAAILLEVQRNGAVQIAAAATRTIARIRLQRSATNSSHLAAARDDKAESNHSVNSAAATKQTQNSSRRFSHLTAACLGVMFVAQRRVTYHSLLRRRPRPCRRARRIKRQLIQYARLCHQLRQIQLLQKLLDDIMHIDDVPDVGKWEDEE
ncbi:hypothetical protein PCL_01598 [Purpureocillium lilacinum]|uniref:Uncharacterized protein n=1 Tax=Purpureocillium lilacinum TaxID=33203 RepID=A0A2U3E1Y7_PURLI|nr:hypothetical protein PCL_01598 [Purpureocillium lilacinum]